jgi:hypothetical protein
VRSLVLPALLGAAFLAAPADAAAPPGLTGSWRLIEWTAVDADGSPLLPYGRAAQGRLHYAPDGAMSLLLYRSDRPAFEGSDPLQGSDEEVRTAFEGSFTYYGTWELVGNRVRHRIEGCSFPNWAGSEQERLVRWRGERLVLESPPVTSAGREKVHTLVWERVPPE